MQLEGLFPTPIGFFTFDEGLSDEQKSFLEGQDQRPNRWQYVKRR
jgi:hypothetical protein